MEIVVHQSFGNCPQYIQRRELYPMESRPQPVEHLASLDAAAQALIRTADTSFVASGAHLELAQGGVDISHRGGRPGFIHLEGDTLWMPDFRGNRYMNTLGNLLAEPRAALLFIDFDRGDVLHLQGKTQILWQTQGIPALKGRNAIGGLTFTAPGALRRRCRGGDAILSIRPRRWRPECGTAE